MKIGENVSLLLAAVNGEARVKRTQRQARKTAKIQKGPRLVVAALER
jgi:ribosomal protein L7Ae-like RNA K-turn-binding protein